MDACLYALCGVKIKKCFALENLIYDIMNINPNPY